jgi:hypothetical protein
MTQGKTITELEEMLADLELRLTDQQHAYSPQKKFAFFEEYEYIIVILLSEYFF